MPHHLIPKQHAGCPATTWCTGKCPPGSGLSAWSGSLSSSFSSSSNFSRRESRMVEKMCFRPGRFWLLLLEANCRLIEKIRLSHIHNPIIGSLRLQDYFMRWILFNWFRAEYHRLYFRFRFRSRFGATRRVELMYRKKSSSFSAGCFWNASFRAEWCRRRCRHIDDGNISAHIHKSFIECLKFQDHQALEIVSLLRGRRNSAFKERILGEDQTPGGGMGIAVEVQGCLTQLTHHPGGNRRTLRGRNDGG